ncbi:hypothetical protein HGRIS_003649 [Hohenbuehelia grisea]|uniref:SH3 domain-containing protein n=1 Tax=Hohenbuehelia grisea TaxID=104357 RepID=A0ABR3JHT6_9AGAR
MVAIDSDALLSHILSQTRQNVQFLIDQNHLSAVDGREIMARLPAGPNSVQDITQATQRLGFSAPTVAAVPAMSPPYNAQVHKANVPPPPPPPQQPQYLFQAKALWDYNADPNDLSFRAGDIIDVVEETNPDWWTGRLNGRQALFPSNYAEKLASGRGYAAPPPMPSSGAQYSEKSSYSTPVYSPPQGPPAQYGYQAPPANTNSYNSYAAPAPPASAPAPAPEEPKKGKLGGKLGNTACNIPPGVFDPPDIHSPLVCAFGCWWFRLGRRFCDWQRYNPLDILNVGLHVV